MRVSKKCDYALRALFHLAQTGDRTPVPIRELAQKNDVPRRFLENIMVEMKETGWVRSVAGRDGGYCLAVPASSVTLGAVVRHFDGVLAPVGCVAVTDYRECSQGQHCRFRRVFLEIRNLTDRLMESASIAQVMAGAPVTKEEVFREELTGGLGI